MREEAMRTWMKNQKKPSGEPWGKRHMDDVISRLGRVQKGLQVDLDEEYRKDGGENLIRLLDYTAEDQKNHRPAPGKLYFKPGANLRDGMASLKNAVKKYFDFCSTGA